jgi:DNA-binding GntR family transcriptional regulator
VGTIELAVRNATNQQIAQLSELAKDYKQAARAEADILLLEKVDVAFHTLLLEMTGSTLIAGMQRVLVDFFHKLTTELQADPTLARPADRVIREHMGLASAIRNRDVDRARTILSIHLRHYLPPHGRPMKHQTT